MFASITCEPVSFSWFGVRPFTVALVPTGMNTGVSTMPWPVNNLPLRAEEFLSCVVISKLLMG